MRFFNAALLVAPLLSGVQAATKTFKFSLSDGNAAPDGFTRKYTLINGSTPGPIIDVNQGDDVEIVVTNTAPENATVHFHGIEMFRTPWNDGVPGISQRPIKTGETYTYRWKATQYGAYWYHSHYRGQIEDGLYGAIIIRPSSTVTKPFSKISSSEVAALTTAEANRKPLIINDVTHLHSEVKESAIKTSETEVSCYDSIVFNGKGNVNCLDHATVQAALTDNQKGLLAITNDGAEMTDKACVPAKNIDAALGATGKPQLMPSGIFSGCKATTGTREVISATAGQWVAIDVIGANNFILAVFSIDEHDMWVYAVDGEYVTPQLVQAFQLNNGDRVSIMVKAKNVSSGAFKIRVHAATPPQILIGYSVLSIGGASSATEPTSKSWINLTGGAVSSSTTFLDYSKATQFNAQGIPKKADAFFKFHMKADASWLWAMNTTRLDIESIDTTNRPVIVSPNFDEPKVDSPVFMSTNNNTWVDLLFWAPGNSGPMPPHPIHKHGNKMFHLGSGHGDFTWNSINDAIDAQPSLFNLVNPPKVDAVMTPEASPPEAPTGVWAAVRYHVTDPGAWALHCHIHNHVEGGMLAVVQDGLDKWPTIPAEYRAILGLP